MSTIYEMTEMLPLAWMCVRAKGFETIKTSLVSRLENLDSTSDNVGKKR